MNNSARNLFIFNPAADKGRAARKERWLQELLVGRSDSVMIRTTCAGHAAALACSGADEYSGIIACGGDGTVHEIANAVAGKGIPVGILPMGSANDFIKTLNPCYHELCGIAHFFTGESLPVDLGRLFYGNGNHQYFVNSLGIGFTGRIAKAVKQTRWFKGELAYVYALLKVLCRYKPIKIRITLGLENSLLTLNEAVFALSVMNGKVEGGKFRIAPSADLSDGLLDVCILKSIPMYSVFSFILKYIRGTHIDDPRVLYCKVKTVEVILEEPDVMHIDGEVVENVCGRIAISVVPKGLTVVQGITS